MKNFNKTGRIFYGIAITGIGLVHFVYPGFRPVLLPVPSPDHFTLLPILTGASLALAGLWILFGRNIKLVATLLGLELLFFFLFGHLPSRLTNHPEILGVWTDAIKLLALAGGAFIVARDAEITDSYFYGAALKKVASVGAYLFSIMLILFGIDHFLYVDLVASLVPTWIPLKQFWTYFTGIALIGSGIAIGFNLFQTPVSLLLSLMLLSWLFLLHLPAFFAAPDKDAINIISSLECLAYCGMALFFVQRKTLILRRSQISVRRN